MILVQHRTMTNRNLISNITTLSFNEKGIAEVQDRGSAREDIAAFMRGHPGQISFIEPTAVKEPSAVISAPIEVEVPMETRKEAKARIAEQKEDDALMADQKLGEDEERENDQFKIKSKRMRL